MELSNQPKPSFRLFLSHRYKSPKVNAYFFGLFNDEAEVQFEVDVGTIATNVTRLERLIRDADAFVGIYPYANCDQTPPKRADLLRASRYFRLELDLAIRARKPSLVFVDSRYGNVLDTPSSILRCQFDYRDVLSEGMNPSELIFRRYVQLFRDMVTASIKYKVFRPDIEQGTSAVGLLLPPASNDREAYSNHHLELLESQLPEHNVDPIQLPWPPVLNNKFYDSLEKLDWLIVDLGERAVHTGLVPFLHGRFIPMVRLLHVKQDPVAVKPPQIQQSLFGAHDVGYPKDLLRWSDEESISSGLNKRLAEIYTARRLISTWRDATEYFRSAALRKEAVFVSYSSQDDEIAAGLIQAVKGWFQNVFDYRDQGESIRPGEPWLEETFARLSTSAIGIMLLSGTYLSSDYCLQEARQMVALQLQKQMRVFPVRVRDEKLDIPPWLRDTQHLRLWQYKDSDAVVQSLINIVDG